jgi:hypothetical protein
MEERGQAGYQEEGAEDEDPAVWAGKFISKVSLGTKLPLCFPLA